MRRRPDRHLGELHILLPGAQQLTAFLITVPFSGGFSAVVAAKKRAFIATFMRAVASLAMLSAPAPYSTASYDR